MRKLRLIAMMIVGLFTISTYGQQHDLKINISNIFIFEANANYEYILSDYATIGGMFGYAYGLPDDSEPNKYVYVGPEFRYYVSPKNGADQFFIGLYSRFKSGTSFMSFNESGYSNNGFEYLSYYQNAETSYTKLAVGLTLGGKWVVNNGFVFGVFGGIGRNLFSSYDESSFVSHASEFDPNSYYTDTYNNNDSKYWDFRIGFNIGWRIGK